MSHGTDVLLLHADPALCCFHHATTVQSAESKPMVDMVTTSIDRPAIFLGVWDACRLHDDVLNIAPRQVPTETYEK